MIPRFSPDYHWGDMAKCFLPASGRSVRRLEEQLAEKAGHSSAILFRYGRTGLYCLLKAIGAQNKKVILPAYTCVVVANAIVLSGNIPVFLDNEPDQFQPAPERYLEAIDDDTAMVIPTHLFGLAQETKALCDAIRERHPNVFVVQDCAHSFFCSDSTGKTVTEHGDAALFGMNISKLVNSVHGGALTLKDARIAEEVRRVWAHERETSTNTRLGGIRARLYSLCAGVAFTPPLYPLVGLMTRHTALFSSEVNYYRTEVADLPNDFLELPTPFEAEIGLRSLERFGQRVERRREIADLYFNQLSDAANAGDLVLAENRSGNTWSHFPILVPAQERDRLASSLTQTFRVEIGRIVDYSIPDLDAYHSFIDRPALVASDIVNRVLNLPLAFREGIMPMRQWKKQCSDLGGRLASEVS